MRCSSTAARMSSARSSSAAASTSCSFTRSSARALQRPDTSVGYRPAMRRGVVASILTAVLALVALGLIGAAPAAASPAAQYGIQDDAWLMYGPGTLSSARRHARSPRHPARPLHAALGPGRPDPTHVTARSRRQRISVGAVRDRAPGAPRRRDHDARHAIRVAGLGERRPPAELAPGERARRLRLRGLEAVPVGAPLDGLERAERPDVLHTRVAARLRAPAAQPGIRVAAPGELRERRCRRSHLAAQDRLRACRRSHSWKG